MVHLIKRFAGHLTATPLTASEATEVSGLLAEPLADLFFAMAEADQRHAFDVYVRTGRDPLLAETALMHDVGKVAAPMGPVSRSFATVATACRIPVGGSWAIYRDHGPIGAEMLATAGATEFTVAFTQTHPGPAPHGFDADAWERLAAADQI
ncbi:MAG: hypothetical protein DWP92_08555 [Armatimonadetes bacterium]|nr:MAG: hypothetical protein DWP92_08555 [Armatimonadota bacterium]